ncbi:MAG: IS110 family transposase [Bacteroidales bacterium]|nr:IS110 family transposase [Bacteroidales bacterium]
MRIKEILSEYEHVQEKLKAIPGLNTKTVEDLLAEIGLDMSAFPSEKHLASWAGMCPCNNESTGKKKRTKQFRQLLSNFLHSLYNSMLFYLIPLHFYRIRKFKPCIFCFVFI